MKNTMHPSKEMLSKSDLPTLPIPEGHQWQYGAHLGRGGGGSAHMWKEINENGAVVRRLVKKNIEGDPAYIVIQDGPHQGELWEAWAMERVRSHAPVMKVHSVPLLEKPLGNTSKAIWSIYMPYYPYGCLWNIIEPDFLKYRWIWPLPEPFVWLLFHRMATVAVAMDTSFRTPGKEHVLVHNDIKPQNIFLGTPGSEGNDADFPMYPPPVLGDFGTARITYEGDPKAGELTGHGTTVWMPPEIDAWGAGNVRNTANKRPAHSYSNIWQIGLMILGVIEGQGQSGPKPDWFANGKDKVRPENPKYTGVRWKKLVTEKKFNGWSQDLLKLVYECTEFYPEKRPSPQDLVERIEKLMPKHEDVMRRWGTLEWFQQQEREIDMGRTEGDTGGGASSLSASGILKRRRNPEEDTESRKEGKTAKQEITKRRMTLVGKQMSEGRNKDKGPPEHISPDDDRFVLREDLKMFCPNVDPFFDADKYFSVLRSGDEEFVEVSHLEEEEFVEVGDHSSAGSYGVTEW